MVNCNIVMMQSKERFLKMFLEIHLKGSDCYVLGLDVYRAGAGELRSHLHTWTMLSVL